MASAARVLVGDVFRLLQHFEQSKGYYCPQLLQKLARESTKFHRILAKFFDHLRSILGQSEVKFKATLCDSEGVRFVLQDLTVRSSESFNLIGLIGGLWNRIPGTRWIRVFGSAGMAIVNWHQLPKPDDCLTWNRKQSTDVNCVGHIKRTSITDLTSWVVGTFQLGLKSLTSAKIRGLSHCKPQGAARPS